MRRLRAMDTAVREAKKDDWRGNNFKEREVCYAIKRCWAATTRGGRMFEIVKAQRDY